MVCTFISDGENLLPDKVGLPTPKKPNKPITLPEAFALFKPACDAANLYVMEVQHKVFSLFDPNVVIS